MGACEYLVILFQWKLAFFATLCTTCFGQVQEIVLYDEYDQTGNLVKVEGVSIPDLADLRFDNMPLSLCATGAWILYEDPNFNPTGGRMVEYVFGRDNECSNVEGLNDTISSVRFAGDPKDYSSDFFTLYQYASFQGQEEKIFEDTPLINLTGSHESIIVTGKSDWTVYDEPDFQGQYVCVKVPDPGMPTFFADVEFDVEPAIAHGTIYSVKKGCADDGNSEGATAAEGSTAKRSTAARNFAPGNTADDESGSESSNAADDDTESNGLLDIDVQVKAQKEKIITIITE